ncbi:hypothetical protein CMUS01_05007 [Colletotrichum musicola]|uniref:Uncharacterized protein n=1 Tax=Colletotrichum musicola TaxID=2175873 RepID=A0A8H6NKZ8_9PEZI|nr:hypothetical protein CMUS01_05007 [Colletotrichum musicola]
MGLSRRPKAKSPPHGKGEQLREHGEAKTTVIPVATLSLWGGGLRGRVLFLLGMAGVPQWDRGCRLFFFKKIVGERRLLHGL